MEVLLEAGYIFAFLALFSPIATVWLLRLFNKCDHPVWSTIIGLGVGILGSLIVPFSFITGLILPVTATIVTNFVIAPMINDKLNGVVEGGFKRDYVRILTETEKPERLKYLKMHDNKAYKFKVAGTQEAVYKTILEKTDEAAVKGIHSQANRENWENGGPERNKSVVKFVCPPAAVYVVVTADETNADVMIYKDRNVDDPDYQTRLNNTNQMLDALDNTYIFIRGVLRELDPDCKISFE
ncbi:MAG: hypothetical protein FWE74_05795 [Oscillospiraceae bacterium]|nr:hypothetical protein [Oscillospiraceae bacterium]